MSKFGEPVDIITDPQDQYPYFKFASYSRHMDARNVPIEWLKRMELCFNALADIPNPAEYRLAVRELIEAAKTVTKSVTGKNTDECHLLDNLEAVLAKLEGQS